MSIEPLNIIPRDLREFDILLGYEGSESTGFYVKSSIKIPLPYYILSLTWFPQYGDSGGAAWGEIYLSDSSEETTQSISSRDNILTKTTSVRRLKLWSFYDHITLDLNQLETKYDYIYLYGNAKGLNDNIWVKIRVLLTPEEE